MTEDNNSKTGIDEVVVVGSSAGGIEALSILVSTLPADFPAPIILAQHLDPTRPSNLAPILQRRANLLVVNVTVSTKLEPGKIYVVPSNRHVIISEGKVELQGDHGHRPRPSVDLLLSTAAANYGEHLIAVILTGSGSDGAAGAVDVKNAGGTVIVQNPQTARYPSMPLALPPAIVDFEVDIERIGPLLMELVNGDLIKPPVVDDTEKVLGDILEQVGRQASIDFRPYKPSTILRRINRRMAVTNNRTMQDYSLYLETHPEEIGELVQAFLINVTQFFRDPEAFAYLKAEILPQLISQARNRDRVLRLWCAGCASGEEPYSLAMLLADLLEGESQEWSIKIFATDLDEGAINFARRGLYAENFLKGVPADYRDRFLEKVDHSYRISKRLRQMVIFGQQDLSRSAPFPRIDLVLCRNVLIYFTPELQDYVLNQFAFSLSSNGYLFLGKAETVRPAQSYYELVNKQWKIYRCNNNAAPLARRQILPALSRPMLEENIKRSTRMITKVIATPEESASMAELNQLRRINELLLRFLPVGLVVIDRSYRLLTANGAARRLLGLRELADDQDFLHSVRGIPYSQVRAAIDTVFRERSVLTLSEIELAPTIGGNGRYLSLSIALMQLEAGLPDLAAINISDVTEQVETRRQLETVHLEQSRLMGELSEANRRLNDLSKELTDANEELQVANEELMLTHEELQASIEEFETTNEELQATNEELETNNEELQATNEELQATNEELQATNEELRARTGDLQEITIAVENERTRLAEMVESAPFYIVVLRGSNLEVEAFNPRYLPMLHGREIRNQPIEQVPELFPVGFEAVLELAHEVYRQNLTHTIPNLSMAFSDNFGRSKEQTFSYTLVPSHDVSGKVTGVIIYGTDEDEIKAE